MLNNTIEKSEMGAGENDLFNFWNTILNDDEIPEPTQDSTPVNTATAIPESNTGIPENDVLDKQVEKAIENNPTVAEQVTEDVSGEDSSIEAEAEQLNDSNPNNDEVADEAIEQTPIKEKQEVLDKLNNAGSSFMNVSLSPKMDDFINSVEQSERTPEDDKVDAYLQNYNKLPPWQQKEIERIHRSKAKDWAKGKDAKFNNALSGVNESDYKNFLRKQAKYGDLYNLDNFDEDVYKSRGGVNLNDEDALRYYTDKFGQEWVDRQKNFRKNKDIANQNEQLAKLLWKYKQHNILTDPITGKNLTEKQMLKDIANGDFSSLQGLYKKDRQGNSRLPRTYKEREALQGAMDRIKANLEELGKSNEDFIEKYPEASLEEFKDPEIRKEAEQIAKDDNKANDEVNNAKVSSIDWDKVKVYEPGEDAEGYGIEKDSYDPRVEAINEYDYETGVGDPGVLLHRDEDFAGPDEYVDEASGEIKSLEDRQLPALNQQDYHKELAVNGERGLETTDDLAYTVEGESDFVPTVYKIEDLDREIEEAEQMPVTTAEEAKAKQNKLKELRAKRRVAYGNASKSDTTNWNYASKSTATGGRVSPRAGIGSIGGAAGHGSMASTKPTKTGDSHNSIASKAPLPHALEDNQGKVVSVNGKATTAPSSNNNGAFRSGSFGLMSKANSNLKSIPSKAPVSGGAEHMGSTTMSDVNIEDGKQILIKRLKQLLTQLTDEEKKELGFSPALNQWNGKALTRLDGYTLQDLINKVEKYLGEK